ncbi:MAG: outer membrane lipoprotein-sorting protein, partial [Gemmatimonadota bacterium]|nr:outer membrane lipoprotein-sorting protein [Gemmatimonadota bacterium]
MMLPRAPSRLLVLTASLAVAAPPAQAQPSARDIVDRVDQLLRGRSSQGRVTMEIVTADWSRSLDME